MFAETTTFIACVLAVFVQLIHVEGEGDIATILDTQTGCLVTGWGLDRSWNSFRLETGSCSHCVMI